ncbi:MAG: cob(I)yrinic acid a,c-diamide adenosyltransferase, partial [Planctomycetota bacterium]
EVLAAGVQPRLRDEITRIQNELFHVGAELCVPEEDKIAHPGPRIGLEHIKALESLMDELSASLPPLKNFVLPGGTAAAARLHTARTIARRAEREVARLAESETVGGHVLAYLNRLSDALFVMARWENRSADAAEPIWDSRA